jgi:hypothetical protein
MLFERKVKSSRPEPRRYAARLLTSIAEDVMGGGVAAEVQRLILESKDLDGRLDAARADRRRFWRCRLVAVWVAWWCGKVKLAVVTVFISAVAITVFVTTMQFSEAAPAILLFWLVTNAVLLIWRQDREAKSLNTHVQDPAAEEAPDTAPTDSTTTTASSTG